jgi:hypothetical protein
MGRTESLNVRVIYQALGVAQVGGAGVAVLTLFRTESVQLAIVIALGTSILALLRWTLGKLIKIVSDKVDGWDAKLLAMDEALDDVPRRADHAELDRKVDDLTLLATAARTRLDEHSGRIKDIEVQHSRLIARVLNRVVDRLLKDDDDEKGEI